MSDTAWYQADQLKSIGAGTCYCGRTDIEIEEGDGQCGPTNGQCPACEQYQIQFGKNIEEVRRVLKEPEPVLVTGAGTSFINGTYYADSSIANSDLFQGQIYIKGDAMLAFWVQEGWPPG